MLLPLLIACAPTPDTTCARARDAIAACDDAFSLSDACAANLGVCGDEDLARWYGYYDCYARACAEGTAYGEDAACSAELEGVSWGCNPAGGGI